jgi:hypothetical protein
MLLSSRTFKEHKPSHGHGRPPKKLHSIGSSSEKSSSVPGGLPPNPARCRFHCHISGHTNTKRVDRLKMLNLLKRRRSNAIPLNPGISLVSQVRDCASGFGRACAVLPQRSIVSVVSRAGNCRPRCRNERENRRERLLDADAQFVSGKRRLPLTQFIHVALGQNSSDDFHVGKLRAQPAA